MFRAGMELGILNTAMLAMAWIRRRWRFDLTPARAAWFQRGANLLLPFGTDRGGMRVLVVGRSLGHPIRREWRLIAEAGDGPYIPAVAVRALIRRRDRVAPGARPCLAEMTREEAEDAMTDLSVSTTMEEGPAPTLFQSALADRWARLSPEAQALHSVQDIESFSGVAEITRGGSMIARLTGWFFGFPAAGEDIAVTVTKTCVKNGEVWERSFGGQVFRSYCTPAPIRYRYCERFWLFTYELDMSVDEHGMRLPVRRGWFLGMPLPRFLLPTSESQEYGRDGVFHFDVALGAPLGGGLIVRYRGRLWPDRDEPA